mgnify:CR=1 FL=1
MFDKVFRKKEKVQKFFCATNLKNGEKSRAQQTRRDERNNRGSEGDGQYLADPQPIYANRRMRWNDIQRARRTARTIRIIHLLLLQFNIHWINIRQQLITFYKH